MAGVTAEHVETYRRNGFVVVEDVLSQVELDELREDASRYFPDPEEYFRTPRRYENLVAERWFVFDSICANDAATHPALVSFAEQVIGTDDLLMTHAKLWAKYTGTGAEQPLHSDLGNNTLVVPGEEDEFRHVLVIAYLTDVTEDDGPTYVVPRELSNDQLRKGAFTREDHPELYEEEVPVTAKAGSALIYGTRTLHRGSAIRRDGAGRLTLMTGFRKSGYEWMGHHTNFAFFGMVPSFAAWLEHATPRQRQLVGFPAPGHRYWNEQTLKGVARRYPGMDLEPYREAIDA